MIEDLIDDLKADEGWRPFAYEDHLGYTTIGYGFLIDEKKGGRLPLEVGEFWLERKVHEYWNAFIDKHDWVLDQPEDVQRALGNMVYQMGVEGVSKFKQMLKALKEGDREGAAAHALDSRWAEQTPRRAERVAAKIRGF